MKAGVAISTTGERPAFLEAAYKGWRDAGMEVIIVNTDTRREGVAWNKNRGIAGLMAEGVDHLFLADDDMYPLSEESWKRYAENPMDHLMLCWGRSRLSYSQNGYSVWTHPRGVMLYMTRKIVERAGGMRTEFRNGHEHVEYSRRIANILGHSDPFVDLDSDAAQWFHCEDMRGPREGVYQHGQRRRRISTVHRSNADREHNNALLAEYAHSKEFIPYD